MRLLRHPLLRRALALLLLGGLGAWVAAPAAWAHPRAAQVAQHLAGGPVERALAEALAAAAHAPETFGEALHAALAARPDGEALARYLDAAGSPEALLDLLVGQLLRNAALPGPVLGASGAVAVVPVASPALRAVPPAADAVPPPACRVSDAPPAASHRPVGLLAVLSSAQPLGP